MSHPSEGQDRTDYRETEDITEVHASVLREHDEPKAGTMPIPMWLGALGAGVLCWAAVYVGMFHGGFSSSIYNEYNSSPSALFKSADGDGEVKVVELTLAQIGEKVYASKCAACHQPAGTGNAQIPPVAGSEWVDGAEYGEKRLIAALLKGIGGPISVKGGTYNGAMPNWDGLKDKEIAAVSTYIRQAFGNKGTGEITEAAVKAVRKEFADRTKPWTAEELKQIPVNSPIGGAAAAAPAAANAPAEKPAAPAATTAAPATAAAPAAPSSGSFDLAASVKEGQPIYNQTCMACHQATGLGLPGAFPPLAKTDYVNGDPRRLVAISLKGISGAMTVDGKVYATGMPSPELSFPQLKDDKNLANVLNYVRNSFGNKSDVPITPEFVAKVRKEFESKTTQWTEPELLNFPPSK